MVLIITCSSEHVSMTFHLARPHYSLLRENMSINKLNGLQGCFKRKIHLSKLVHPNKPNVISLFKSNYLSWAQASGCVLELYRLEANRLLTYLKVFFGHRKTKHRTVCSDL